MDSNTILFFISVILVFTNAAAFNITMILDKYPSFSTFNSYLTQTQISSTINARQPPITVLAVDNSNIAPMSGKTLEVLEKIMSVHVLLDYFDVPKLQGLEGKSMLATTLFQTSGLAGSDQGVLNITDLSGSALFASAAKGATTGSNLVKAVHTEPYDLSVLEISGVIVPPGIDSSSNTNSSSSNSTSSANSPSARPVSPVPAASPSISPAASPSTSPAASLTNPPAASPTNSPAASTSKPPAPSSRKMLSPAPSKAKTPSASPKSSPPAPVAGAPATTADAPSTEDDSSAGRALGVSAGIIVALVSSSLFLMG